MKGLRFANTQQSGFEAWKSSYMGFSPCYVVDLMILRNRVFRLRNVQIWVSAVLQGGRSADIHEYCFQAAKRSDMVPCEMKGIYLLIVTNGFFGLEKLR